MAKQKIAGVVLAGGRSSRMGQNKALLSYNGRPLVDHMLLLLKQAGCDDVFISGDLPGYRCLVDPSPYQGPGIAMAHLCDQLAVDYQAVLFIPVDMPFLPVEAIVQLQQQPQSCHFEDYPLPAWVQLPAKVRREAAVKSFMALQHCIHLPLPPVWAQHMLNLNTPTEWQEACGHAPTY